MDTMNLCEQQGATSDKKGDLFKLDLKYKKVKVQQAVLKSRLLFQDETLNFMEQLMVFKIVCKDYQNFYNECQRLWCKQEE
jgi:hypothetical protein